MPAPHGVGSGPLHGTSGARRGEQARHAARPPSPPASMNVPDGMYYNDAYPGNLIAMPQPLYGDDVTYADGADTSIKGSAADLTQFLMWAAEPKMEVRKRIGVAVVFFLSIFVVLSVMAKRRVWADLH